MAATLGPGGRVRCEPGWRLAPEWSAALRDHDLWCVWSGRGTMQLHDRAVALRPGTVVWMRPGGRYVAEQDAEERLGVTFMHFTPARGVGVQPPFEAMETLALDYVDASLRRVLALREGAPDLAAQVLAALLATLAHEAGGPVGRGRAGVELQHRRMVDAVMAAVEEDPGRAVTVARLAREAGYSADHFARVFTKVAGLSPQAFLLRTRMERARRLLAESDLRVSEIADVLGFRDVFYFSRLFSEKNGVSPRAFRVGWRRSGAEGAVPAEKG